MNIHKVYELFLNHFRLKRMMRFEEMFSITKDSSILDVGGDQYNWSFLNVSPRVMVLNLSKPSDWVEGLQNFKFIFGDGTDLQFPDRSFEVAFSNSVIEHLGDWNRQEKFAQEMMRVGRGVYVQTPAQEFFVEPHLLTPFIHWLPLSTQEKLMRNFTIWGLITRPSRQYVKNFLNERRLLTYSEFCKLFPHCRIIRERFLGMTKSYIAVYLQ